MIISKICRNMCDQKDIKLKEAQRTIVNKDVIIKMLQDHVKKLEDSYKQNMNETESFRYKYCLAAEQIRRLRGGNCLAKCPRRQSRDLKEGLNQWKQQCDQLSVAKEKCAGLPNKCSYFQQLRNVEKVMKDHYQLLETIVDKISEKNVTSNDDKKVENGSELKALQEEVERLKQENSELHESLHGNQPRPSITAKDSLLETYKRNNQQLQEKVESLATGLFKKDDDSIDEPVLGRTISFGNVDKPIVMENSSSDEEIATVEENPTVIVITPVNDEEVLSYSRENSPEVKKEDTYCVNGAISKINEVHEKIIEVFEKQTSIFDHLSSMKENLTNSLKTTQGFTENMFNVIGTMNEQNGMFYQDFQEHKAITESLAKGYSEMNQQLLNLNNKVDSLGNSLNTQKSERRRCSKTSTQSCTNQELKNLEEKYERMKSQDLQMDRKIKCMNALISYYQNLQTQCTTLCPEKPCDEKVDSYVDKVKTENLKMKTTISSVIGELNEKMSELKCVDTKNSNDTNGTTCSYFKKSPLRNADDAPSCSKKGSNPELDIQDVYNAVRRTVMKEGNCIPEMCVCGENQNQNSDCQAEKTESSDNCCTENIAANLQSYINYLHEQLGVITDIEGHIDNLRKDANQ